VNARTLPARVAPPAPEQIGSVLAQPDADLFLAERAPKRLRLVTALNLALIAALVLLSLASIDIYAVAQGRIGPAGRSKIVQSLGTGLVKTLLVANGSHVRAGDLVVELDATSSITERDDTFAQLDALNAEIARRTATAAAVTMNGPVEIRQPISFDNSVSRAAQERAQRVNEAELIYLSTSLSALDAKIQENAAQREALALAIAAQRRLTATLEERVTMWRSVLSKGLASRSNVIEAEETSGKEQANLASLEGQLLSARAAEATLHRNKADAIAKFIADNSKALADAQSMREQLTQRLIKASTDVRNTRLVAPIDGTVQQLTITTIGQVVTSGQKLMMVVPDNPALEVEALVQNKDAGFVRPGQQAILSIDTFPSSIYGTVPGRVSRVARDAVDSQEAVLTASGSVENPLVSSAFESLNLVYPITVTLNKNFVTRAGRKIPLAAGMTVQVRIRTGRRRLIDYLFAPLHDTIVEAGHER
jgi:hemolysin D